MSSGNTPNSGTEVVIDGGEISSSFVVSSLITYDRSDSLKELGFSCVLDKSDVKSKLLEGGLDSARTWVGRSERLLKNFVSGIGNDERVTSVQCAKAASCFTGRILSGRCKCAKGQSQYQKQEAFQSESQGTNSSKLLQKASCIPVLAILFISLSDFFPSLLSGHLETMPRAPAKMWLC